MIKLRILTNCSVFLVVLFLIGHSSCERHEVENIKNDFSIDNAKKWLSSQEIQPKIVQRSNLKSSVEIEIPIRLQWDNAFTQSLIGEQVVEIPIETFGKLGFAFSTINSLPDPIDNKFFNSLTRVLIVKDDYDSIKCLFMTIVADSAYMVDEGYDLNTNSYKNISSDFCGIVLFHEIYGEFKEGFRYDNGIKTGTISSLSFEFNPFYKNASMTCTTYALVTNWEQCTEWYTNGRLQEITCDYWTTVNYFQQCTFDDGSGGGGGNGNGNTTATSSDDSPERSTTKNPCDQLKDVAKDVTYMGNLKKIYDNRALNQETMYFFGKQPNTTDYFYDYRTGPDGQCDLGTMVSPNNCDGYMHSHFGTCYPIFSVSDLKGMYNMLTSGRLRSPVTSEFSVAAPDGNVYTLKITDEPRFRAWGNVSFLNNQTEDFTEKIYKEVYKIDQLNGMDAEKAFLKFLGQVNGGAGLTLFKADLSNKTFTKRVLPPNNTGVVNGDCQPVAVD